METNQKNSCNAPAASSEPIRTRWTPKPEQILILESIFESGMVNPAKDETVRIRKLLEKFGSVGDANVFYWFQNRRSRSRRRQRQIQASLAAASGAGGGQKRADYEAVGACGGEVGFCCGASSSVNQSLVSGLSGFGFNQQMGGVNVDGHYVGSYETAHVQCPTGSISVFINGIPSEVPSGLINIRAMFGDDAMLIHSSGEPLPSNEYGILLQSLQMGQSYYLVARPT